MCLPVEKTIRSNKFVGYQPFAAGWGRLSENGKSPNILQELQVPVHDTAVCRKAYREHGIFLPGQFDDTVLCAGDMKGGKGICKGDSGGPLMQPIMNTITKKHHFYQIGVVSYGLRCAEPNAPTVYARVTYFIDWIQETIKKLNAV